jgi:preprotein translocase subunit SecA
MNASRSKPTPENPPAVIDRIGRAAAAELDVELRQVQVAAGTHALGRCVVEMQTGEGKTLTTVIPAAIQAMRQGTTGNVLVATANDYLAARDADWMRPIYQALNLRVGSITSGSTTDQRREAYGCDVTYGTLQQFAFDFLRHSLANRESDGATTAPASFRFDALIVDEADSVLIDEARTPMVITAPTRAADEAAEACFRWSARQVADYGRDQDYVRLASSGEIALTERGRARAIQGEMPQAMGRLTTTEILHSIERAIWVNQTLHRDQHYVVKDDRIHLIDEYTGRMAERRNFAGGIQQAIEAREGLGLSSPSQPVARISVQEFVSKFDHLCGLTATAWEDRRELRMVYGLKVRRIATHHRSQRTILEPIVCGSRDEKWQRIISETRNVTAAGRSVLIGTRTIDQSEQLSERFRRASVDHVVLNARNISREAAIIARAGQIGRVTIATNLAGRGTDIRLDPRVARAGGLHVIVSEPHAAARIDRQLIGRCARQGDPGTARLFSCPEDQILAQSFGDRRAEQIRQAALRGAGDRWLLAKIKQAQRAVARRHCAERARLTAHETTLSDAMKQLGLDPLLDPLPETR